MHDPGTRHETERDKSARSRLTGTYIPEAVRGLTESPPESPLLYNTPHRRTASPPGQLLPAKNAHPTYGPRTSHPPPPKPRRAPNNEETAKKTGCAPRLPDAGGAFVEVITDRTYLRGAGEVEGHGMRGVTLDVVCVFGRWEVGGGAYG